MICSIFQRHCKLEKTERKMKKKKEETTEEQETVGLQASETKLALARRVIRQMKQQMESLELLLEGEEGAEQSLIHQADEIEGMLGQALAEKVIEGVFDGEQMVGEDGQKYAVPANYASKSKLVEGDLLRLMINSHGRFIFKQKGPIERQRLMGTLVQDDATQDWLVAADGKKFRVLSAAISYHHGESNDQIVILVPKNTPSRWAAVENVIKKEMGEF